MFNLVLLNITHHRNARKAENRLVQVRYYLDGTSKFSTSRSEKHRKRGAERFRGWQMSLMLTLCTDSITGKSGIGLSCYQLNSRLWTYAEKICQPTSFTALCHYFLSVRLCYYRAITTVICPDMWGRCTSNCLDYFSRSIRTKERDGLYIALRFLRP